MQTLRPYQRKAKSDIERAWSTYRAPLLVAPTGSGKTVIIAHLVRDVPRKRVLFLCPARELVFQGRDRLLDNGVSAGVLMGRLSPKGEPVHVATVQTAARRDLGDYDLVIIDEAHRALAPQCAQILQRYKNAKILGVTATPIRLDGKPLSRVFDHLVMCSTVSELIRDGYLVPYRVYAPDTPPDLARVKVDKRTKDYSSRSLSHHYVTPRLVGDAVEHWQRLAYGKPTFVYCTSIPHAEETLKAFTGAGIRANMITGETGRTRRDELLGDLRGRKLHVLVNVGVLTEGVDCPEVECLVILRPTLSLGLHLQILGRGSRPARNKRECLVLDHADNHRRHGFYDEPREWSLKGRGEWSNKAALGRNAPQAKKCPNCGAMIPTGAGECPQCGAVQLPVVGEGRLVRKVRKTRVRWA